VITRALYCLGSGIMHGISSGETRMA